MTDQGKLPLDNIRVRLRDYEKSDVDDYIFYINSLSQEKKDGKLKNPWIFYRSAAQLAQYFINVEKDGLRIDGKHITISTTGVSYDYIAFKTKLLSVYPESIIDHQVVYDGEKFNVKKESGDIIYSHHFSDNIFEERTDNKIVGAYVVIKNSRGNFLTILTRKEIDKHRLVAKTDAIWEKWFPEMCLKTVIKKACKQHFYDDFKNIEDIDNENNNIENTVDIPVDLKSEVEVLQTISQVENYYKKNKKRFDAVQLATVLDHKKQEIMNKTDFEDLTQEEQVKELPKREESKKEPEKLLTQEEMEILEEKEEILRLEREGKLN